MYRAILIPLDGSAVSEQALPAAVALARDSGARLHLVQVVGYTEDKDRAYLQGISERASEELGESVDFQIVEEDAQDPLLPPSNAEIASALRTYAEDQGIELIVMSTHGRGALRRAWLGSVADTVIRGSRLPVLLIRPGTWREVEGRKPFQRIVVPLDGSESADAVVRYAADLARMEGARIVLMRIVPPPVIVDAPYWLPVADEATTNLQEAAGRELEAKVKQLNASGIEAEAVVQIGPEPAAAILDYVDREGIELIAMTSRGRSKWERLLLGSVAERVLHNARVPVLLFPPIPLAAARPGAGSAAEVVTAR